MANAVRLLVGFLLLFSQPAIAQNMGGGGINNGSTSSTGGSGTVTGVTIATSGGGANTGTCTSTAIINCTISTQLVTGATLTSSGNVLSTYAGQQVIGNAATAQTLTLQGITTSQYLRFINKGAGVWTFSAGTGSINSGCTSVAQNQSADIQFDGTNWNIACGAGSGATGAAGGSLAGTYPNPTIASSVALPGSPTTTTQTAGDNTTAVATDAFVTTAVNNAIAGVNPAVAVQVATTAAGDTSALTYNNGASGIGATFTGANNTAITIDGVTFTTVGQRLLVKNDTQSPSGAFNGVYSLTAVQTTITGAIFTRALDYDTPSDMNNTGSIPVTSGTVNTTTSWLLTSSITTVGTSPLTYVQFSFNPATAATTINKTSCALNGSCTVSAFPNPGYVSGRWYPAPGVQQTTGSASVASTVYCQSWVVGQTGMTIKALGVWVSTTSNTNHIALALYNNLNGAPSTLVDFVPVITLGASAGLEVGGTVNNTTDVLAPGNYWACYTADNTTVVVTALLTASDAFTNAAIGNSTFGSVIGSANTFGLSCTAASTCAGSFAAWSTGVFTWSSLASATFALVTTSGNIPDIGLQAN